MVLGASQTLPHPWWHQSQYKNIKYIWTNMKRMWKNYARLVEATHRPVGVLWGAIGLPSESPWLPSGAFGLPGCLCGPRAGCELNVHRLRCLHKKSNLQDQSTQSGVDLLCSINTHRHHISFTRFITRGIHRSTLPCDIHRSTTLHVFVACCV